MIAENLLEQIGFSKQMQEEYEKARQIANPQIFAYAKDYMDDKLSMQEIDEELKVMDLKDMSIYTVYLLFILECTQWAKEKYIKNGRTEEQFVTAMKDITYKVKECEKRHGIFGTHTFLWYNSFFTLNRFAATRLQFNRSVSEKTIQLENYTVNPGDLIFNCHIPSAGPLTYDLRLKSYKELYDFYKDELKDGILVIHCNTWLLYPGYKEVFGENSNTVDFARDFEIYDVENLDTFPDAWRVFYKNFEGDTSVLPKETRLQKALVEYLDKTPDVHGKGIGVILFDGEKILTRK